MSKFISVKKKKTAGNNLVGKKLNIITNKCTKYVLGNIQLYCFYIPQKRQSLCVIISGNQGCGSGEMCPGSGFDPLDPDPTLENRPGYELIKFTVIFGLRIKCPFFKACL